ncbi:uracil-DNA glycosylase [Streptococcus ruminantium]|uniref:Uracil-DNA glycosylase n=1 Tax=Streptococcus ruminantium TaxID=1917441 RepID=A0ABU1B3U2_9STRE|nr:uracil-DNA glycosylase [Streptococcus ruminantium]MDQ8758844.1 uracil-DNA glycosylase [Streptococcus ruminantium]MDQ8765892.1 uracil-DNA glycosylase [Streptococcus ruminantium]MDQ8767179.1 uracil-DNA glycosylase [Streptococcus ruminantium]MDQ8768239.1 uracil-DNA glycosylase [Streptococcus ruminantium]MDQ8774682.1 uracil-DNA glycosylase [Streptococcus ruminantium]
MKHSAWHDLIKAQLPEHYFGKINQFLDYVYAGGIVYPPREKVFAAIQTTALDKVKVVILGQDPYHGPQQAQGLSFSVPNTVPAPPSLQNILKELANDIGIKEEHDLTSWAEQGVLLLNACLTVPAGRANGHAGQIWEPFTDAIIKVVNNLEQPVVYILWGSYARKKKALITNPKHLIIESAHPSPLSAHRGFFGSRPFSQTNDFLIAQGLVGIDWLK